mgnify:CR=1 FL=1
MKQILKLIPYALAGAIILGAICLLFGCVSGSYTRETYYPPSHQQLRHTPPSRDMIGDPETYEPSDKPALKSRVRIEGQDSRSIWGGVSGGANNIMSMITDPENSLVTGLLSGGGIGAVLLSINNFFKNRAHKAEVNRTWDEAHAAGRLAERPSNK